MVESTAFDVFGTGFDVSDAAFDALNDAFDFSGAAFDLSGTAFDLSGTAFDLFSTAFGVLWVAFDLFRASLMFSSLNRNSLIIHNIQQSFIKLINPSKLSKCDTKSGNTRKDFNIFNFCKKLSTRYERR